jgi:hypothetical protein
MRHSVYLATSEFPTQATEAPLRFSFLPFRPLRPDPG